MFAHYALGQRRRLPSGLILAAGIAALIGVTPAFAATWTWTGGGATNNWFNGGNWTPLTVPANDGTADIIFGGTTRLTPDLNQFWSVNSVTFNGSAGAFNLSSTAGNTLIIGAGGITNFDTGDQSISHAITLSAAQTWSASSGNLVTSGAIHNGGNLLTTEATGRTVYINGALSGGGGLTKNGLGDLVLQGSTANTYTGTTTINGGWLILNKSAGNAVIGALNVGDGVGTAIDNLYNFASNQIADSATVSVFSTGVWTLFDSSSETITNLNIVSTGIAGGGLVTIGSGTLSVLGNMTMTGGTIQTVSTGKLLLAGALITNVSTLPANISSSIDLGGGTRTFTIADGLFTTDLNASGSVSNGEIIKGGTGGLLLSGVNTYAGGTTLNDGAIFIGHDSALGTGPLTLNGGTIAASAADRTIANAVVLGGNATVDGASNLTLTGALSGSGGLTKNGPGELILQSLAANTYAGTTAVNAGSLRLNTPTGRAISGALDIGDGVGTEIDSVLTSDHHQMPDSTVSVFSTGAWNLNTTDQTITNLNVVSTGIAGGGLIAIGSGTLYVNGNVTMAGGTITGFGSSDMWLYGDLTTNAAGVTASISSQLDLTAGAHTFTIADGAAPNDLDISGVVRNGSIIKDGPGALRLGAANTYAGGTTLNDGTILIGHDSALGTGPLTGNGGTLRADGAARTIANAVTGSFAVDGAFDLALNSPLNGDITKNGPGTLVFVRAGAITDSLTVNAGTVRVDAAVTFAGGVTNSASLLLGLQTLTVNGAGLDNQGSLPLAGGALAGSGPVVNNGLMSGTGTIGGTGGFTNNAQLTVSGGNLTLANAGANSNVGNLDVPAGLQLRLTGGTLANTGTVDIAGSIVAGTATLSNNAGGTVSGRGTITAPFANAGGMLRAVGGTMNVTSAFTNSGVIRLDDGAGLVGGAITNTGRIQGDGSISNALTNSATGSIRVDAGKTLFFSGAFAANAGEFNLQGGTLDFTGAITNSATGFIAGRGAIYTAGLTNNGQMAFSGGTADIHGDVTFNAGSRVVTSGAGSVTTFFDDVVHNGTEIFTGASASTVFFGDQSGAGPFTGTGTVYYIGDLRPGNSPANVNYGGDLVFSGAASLTLEIGGTTPGSQHDRLTIAGSASLDGALDVSLINGFTPSGGQQFTILTAGSIVNNGFMLTGSAASSFSLLVNSTSVILQATGLPGDFNHDNTVDAADYVVWRKGVGVTPTQENYNLWQTNFGQTAPGSGSGAESGATGSASAKSAVPEPTSLALYLLAVVGFFITSRGWVPAKNRC